MSDDGPAAFYRRYNACCNEHRFEDLAQFVAPDVAINGSDRGRDMYAESLRSVVRAFPDYRWELRHLLVEPPCFAVHLAHTGRTARRSSASRRPAAPSVPTSSPSTASTQAGSPRCGKPPSTCISCISSGSASGDTDFNEKLPL